MRTNILLYYSSFIQKYLGLKNTCHLFVNFFFSATQQRSFLSDKIHRSINAHYMSKLFIGGVVLLLILEKSQYKGRTKR